MATHQTIVVELGTSRIKVGFAGESKPRRVLSNDFIDNGGRWTVNINDGMISNACHWSSFFQYLSSPSAILNSTAACDENNNITSVYDWEKTLYPLFSHILTSIVYIQRPSRHRMLIMINDIYPPINFHKALHTVLLNYLNVGSVWLVNGGVFEGIHHLLEGLPPSVPALGNPKAHLLVDIGTYEARVAVSVTGSSILGDTLQTTSSGYTSFLRQVLTNYQQMNEEGGNEGEEAGKEKQEGLVSTLEDANAIVRAWIALSLSPGSSLESTTTISVDLPSQSQTYSAEASTAQQLPAQPLLNAFHQIYLDFTNPSSLIYAILSCIMTCPIDYRKSALQNVMLLGGASVALQRFGSVHHSVSSKGLSMQLEMAAREACGLSMSDIESMDESKEEEKKEDGESDISSIAKQRFQSLRSVVDGTISDDGKRIGGINIQYPEPFAADLATWIGGSVMGTLGYNANYKKKI